jgi:succinyl-CoA synthetase beta subunit
VLTGPNEEIALKILKENGMSAMTDMEKPSRKAVALATGKAA